MTSINLTKVVFLVKGKITCFPGAFALSPLFPLIMRRTFLLGWGSGFSPGLEVRPVGRPAVKAEKRESQGKRLVSRSFVWYKYQ
jgi:hypothetical protein